MSPPWLLRDCSTQRTGMRVWDMCAAPGGKTTHLAEIMQNQGTVLASDIEFRRIRNVEQTRDRLGLNIISTRTITADGRNLPDGPFDAILVDAPCSNSGVLGKRPKARHRVTAENVAELCRVADAVVAVGAGSVWRRGDVWFIPPAASNRRKISRSCSSVLADRSDVELREEQEHLPGEPVDGGYQALSLRT